MFRISAILFAVFCVYFLSGCAHEPTKYLMKNCQDSALRTAADEVVEACEKQNEFRN